MANDPDLRQRVNVIRSTVPAITHVDHSARLQTVDEERHPRFHRLLAKFWLLTGCPMLVNTSFNVRGEPIVCTPEDAFRCYQATAIDALVLEDLVLEKQGSPPVSSGAARAEHLGAGSSWIDLGVTGRPLFSLKGWKLSAQGNALGRLAK